MYIYCDYCVYHYKSTELVSLYTVDIGLIIINGGGVEREGVWWMRGVRWKRRDLVGGSWGI